MINFVMLYSANLGNKLWKIKRLDWSVVVCHNPSRLFDKDQVQSTPNKQLSLSCPVADDIVCNNFEKITLKRRVAISQLVNGRVAPMRVVHYKNYCCHNKLLLLNLQ